MQRVSETSICHGKSGKCTCAAAKSSASSCKARAVTSSKHRVSAVALYHSSNMGLGGALSHCKEALGTVARVVPSRLKPARPAASKRPGNSGEQVKMIARPAMAGFNNPPRRKVLYKAKVDDSTEVNSFQGTLPHLGALDSAPPLKKTSERIVPEASRALVQEEEESIQTMWDICVKVLGRELETDAAMMELQTTLRAAPAGLFAVWPFLGSSSHVTNLVCCKYNIPDLIHAAFHQQRVQQILPLMQELLMAATHIQPNSCPVLHDTLSLLVEMHAHPQLPRQQQDVIASILRCWNLQQMPMQADFLAWADEQPTSWWEPGMTQADIIVPGNGFMVFGVGSLQQARPTTFNSFSAAVQLPQQPQMFSNAAIDSTSTQRIKPDHQNGLYTQADLAAAVQAARQEEQQKAKAALDKAHVEGEQAVAKARREGRNATKRAVAIAIAKCEFDKTDKINVLQTLSEQPSDIFMIKAYYERHTNVFNFDFNDLMRQRRRERLTAETMHTQDFSDSNVVDDTYDTDKGGLGG